jgi:hypothetical protein
VIGERAGGDRPDVPDVEGDEDAPERLGLRQLEVGDELIGAFDGTCVGSPANSAASAS